MNKPCTAIVVLLGLAIPTDIQPARAQDGAGVAGKTITFVIGFEPGGPYDLYGRLLARALGAHLPGQPKVVVQNMPGAGGLIAANYLYNLAPRDGLQIGVISQTAGIGQALETPGVKYDVRKFAWIGRISSNVQILHSWATSATKPWAAMERPRNFASAAASFSASRPQIATMQPSSPSRRAMASPIPLVPPVTSATFPASSRSMGRLSRTRSGGSRRRC